MSDEEIARNKAQEIRNLSASYIADNSWFRFYTGTSGMDPMSPDAYATAAGWAYVYAGKTTSETLALGDTKLRSDQDLIKNFGLSDAESARAASGSASATPAPAASSFAPAIAGSSVATASSPRPPGSTPPPAPAAPGAILSNSKWSPMLNDAFILGGIDTKREFLFLPVGDDASFLGSIAPSAATPPGAGKGQQVQAGVALWKAFFLTKSYLLWDRGFPRVFARELLGLKKFGYKPELTAMNLSFKYSLPVQPSTSFKDYLEYLSGPECRFQKPEEGKKLVLQEISAFLFNDAQALAPIAANAGTR